MGKDNEITDEQFIAQVKTIKSKENDMEWLMTENKVLYDLFLQRKDEEKHGIIGKILCLVGLHKNLAYQYKTHQAEDGIMSYYFVCIRCGRGV